MKRIAETEKYPHVTFFFNGGVEEKFPGEDRIMVPSPKVATYDLKPEMSAKEQGSYTQIEGKSGVTAINQYGKSRTTFIKVNNLPVRNGNWNYYDEFGKLIKTKKFIKGKLI